MEVAQSVSLRRLSAIFQSANGPKGKMEKLAVKVRNLMSKVT